MEIKANKANEDINKYNKFVIENIKKVCKEIGPRESGEKSEHRAQKYVINIMEKIADSVEIEKFKLHPKAFMGWVLADGIMMLVASSLMLLSLFNVFPKFVVLFKTIALILSVVSTVFIIGEFLLYKKLLDPFFPEKETFNVICKRKPKGEIKKRIIFSGHIDSAYEWRYTYLGGGKCLTIVIALGIGCLVLNLLADGISIFTNIGAINIIMKIVEFISIPVFILIAFFLNWKLCVQGANDNLTGVFSSMAVMKYFKDNNIRFENTEIVSISMACEEAGLRGAKAFAEKHFNDSDDVETIAIVVDTLRDFDYMGIYNKDMSGTVKLTPEVAALVKEASNKVGLNLDYSNVFFGSSDAAALVQGGMKACCLAAMDPTPARYYHTRLDMPDNLDEKTIDAGLKTMIESAFIFDEQGLKLAY